MAMRSTTSTTTTRVSHIAKPTGGFVGKPRENGPHLGDLRDFVDACEGLSDDLRVRIDEGHVGESGRIDVTFEVVDQFPTPGQPAA